MTPTPSRENQASPPLLSPMTRLAPVTPRAVLLGAVLAPAVCYWVAYTQIRANSTDLVMMSLMAAALFPLVALLAGNAVLRRFAPKLAWTRGELLTVYVMLTTTAGLAGAGFVAFLAPGIPAPTHFATPENRWANWFRFLKPWATVSDPRTVREFYEGQSQFLTSAHVQAWMSPILFWSAFLLTLLFWGYCLNTLLRRPWMDNEKLLFPIAQIPLEMTRTDVPFWRNRLLWLGIAIPAVLESLDSLHFTFFPLMPYVALKPDDSLNLTKNLIDRPWNSLGYFVLAFYPLAIGLTFLLSAEISFSCWFFYLVGKAELVLATVYGFHDAGASLAASRTPYLLEQGTGAFLGLAVLSLYGARGHLTACARQAVTGKRELDDRDEPMSYRAAVIGWVVSGAAMVGFAMAMGMAWHVAAAFFGFYFLFLVTYTRIRAEAGLPWVMAALFNPHGIMLDTIGQGRYTGQDLTAFARFQWFDMDWRSHMTANQMDGLKIARATGVSLRGLSLAIGVATVTALLGSWLACLHIFYTYGASTAKVNTWYATMGRVPFDILQNQLNTPTSTDTPRVWAMTVGAGMTTLLSLLRTRFVWWPLHPIGYVVANTFTMDWLWCPALLGWASKTLTLRYGGMKTYRVVLPFFVGLIVGDIVISALWTLLFLAFNIPGYRTFPI